MKQLSTNQKNYVILFHDKSSRHITEQQYLNILQLANTPTKGMKIDGNFYTFSSISKILTLEEYYQEYPDLRPDPRPLETFTATQQPKYPKHLALTGLMKGLKEFIYKNPDANKAKKLYNRMVEKLNDPSVKKISVEELYDTRLTMDTNTA